ncbi:MAG: aminotransferase class V-fold PLP-dependent enzyme [Alphaproteobacteria bacterium]|nr:aminotransferase class V-fold PLP-dependent enzyme [Alphaproteobacteria bacterium]
MTADPASTSTQSPIDSALMAQIRDRFFHVESDPVSGPRIFLENGGGSLILKAAIERSAEIAAFPDSPSRRNETAGHIAQIVGKGTEDLRHFFGAESGQILYGATGTEILFRLVRSGLENAERGSVLSSSLEHSASHDAAYRWAETFGHTHVDIPLNAETGAVTPQDYAAATRPDTRLATVIHTSHVTGKRVDLGAIAAAIRGVAPDCLVICDGIQHAPHGPIFAERDGVDAYVFAPYKAFSRRGGAFGWLSDRLANMPHNDQMVGKPASSWSLGSPDPSLYAAASAVHDYLCWLGAHFTDSADDRDRVVAALDAATAHEVSLIDLLINGRDDLPGLAAYNSVTLIGDKTMQDREGAVCFAVNGRNSTEVVDAFATRGIRIHHRGSDAASSSRFVLDAVHLDDCVRVSMCHFNTHEEIEAVLKALPDIVGPS